MTCLCVQPTNSPNSLLSLAAVSTLSLVTVLAVSADPFAEIDLKREALSGSEALLERGVVPPTQPDWIMVDCANSQGRDTVLARYHESNCKSSIGSQVRN